MLRRERQAWSVSGCVLGSFRLFLLSLERLKLLDERLGLLFVLLRLFLGVSNPLLQLCQLLGELVLDGGQLLFDFVERALKCVLLSLLHLVLLLQLIQLLFALLAQLFELLVLFVDIFFFRSDQFFLGLDLKLHFVSLFDLLVFVGLHMFLEVLLDLLDVVDLCLLLLEHVLGLL